MRWLHEHGLISNLADYMALPMPVLEDARLLMEAESAHAQRRSQEVSRGHRR